MFRPDILRRQRQILQQRLYKVHISIIIQVHQDISNRDNRSMTFNYMVYMLYTRKGYFSFLLGAMHRESFHLTEMHKLSRKRRRFTCFIVSSSIRSGVASKMTLRSIRDLEVICPHLVLLHANLYRPRVNGSRVT